jgi:hypothetical protein
MPSVEPYYSDEHVTLYHGSNMDVSSWNDADVLVTDPPYGMSFVSNMRHKDDRVAVANDHDLKARDDVMRVWGDRPAIVFGAWRYPRPEGTKALVVWWKRGAGPGMGDLKMPFGNATEEIYLLGEGFVGKRRENIIITDEQRGGTNGQAAQWGHPTPKPVGLMEQLVAVCPPGVIADPFAGSGATLVAARNLGRQAIGVELEEQYCEVIAKRLSQGALF